jgi:hypothetical protein
VSQALGVTGLLETDDTYVTITDDYEVFGTVAPDAVVWSPDDYDFDVADQTPNGHNVEFTLTTTDANDSTWTSVIGVTVYAPVLEYESYLVDDSGGNGNGIPDPGETVNLDVTIENAGGAAATGISAVVSTTDPLLTITSNSSTYPNLGPGEMGASVTPYVFSVDQNHGIGELATFQLDVTTSGPYTVRLTFDVLIGREPVLIWDADPTPLSGPAQVQALADNGVVSLITNDLFAHGDIDYFQGIFVNVGIYSNNHIIDANSAEALALEAYVQNGGNLYLEGGDLWYYDPLYQGGHDFGPLFGINATSDGSGDLYSVTGLANTLMPDVAGMTFSYTGENSWIDHIAPISPAELILENTSNADQIGVAKEQTGGGHTFGTSFEFGGLVDGTHTKTELMAEIIDFFGIGGVPQPDVSVSLTPDATIYAPGETLGYTAVLTNNTQQVQSFYGIGEVELPNGNPYPGNPIVGPTPKTLGPGEIAMHYITHSIPLNAPAGTYVYTATIGVPPSTVIDLDTFEFDVTP